MKYLYNAVIPEAAQSNERDRLGQQLAEAGILNEDSAAVESIASNAADLRLEGQIRWGEEFSPMLATELDELADSDLPTVPLYRRGGGYPNAGYYEIASADVEPLHANQRDAWSWTLDLTFVGNRAFRAVEAQPRQLDHEFGNDTEPIELAVPAAASKVQWYNPTGNGTRAPATPIETRTADRGDVDIYDFAAGYGTVYGENYGLGSGDATILLYDIGYVDGVRSDVRVYDTRGHENKLSDGGDGPRQWQAVHTTEHDFDAPVVMDNGLLRLRLDESAGTLEAEEWDAGTDSWTTVALSQPATIDLFDVDLTSVAMVSDKAQLTFDVDGELFALNAIVNRGYDAVQFTIPENETGPVPSDLETWLSPIASTSIADPNASKTLVARNDVRR